jgi:hypothetical protein
MPGRLAATARMSVAVSTVAPAVEKPVYVLTNAAPACVRGVKDESKRGHASRAITDVAIISSEGDETYL